MILSTHGQANVLIMRNRRFFFFSRNIFDGQAYRIASLVNILRTGYLGVLAINGKITGQKFSYILDRMKKKLIGWKAATLPSVGPSSIEFHAFV